MSIATTRTETSAGRHSPRREKVGTAAAIAVIACVLVGLLGSILWISWRYAAVVPISDEWSMGSLLTKAESGTLSIGDVWAVHNEHRIVFSRLISLPVVLFLDWNRYTHLVIALIIVLISLALQVRAAWTSIPWRPAALIAIVPIVALFLSLTRFENWTLPFTDKIPTVLGVSLCVWALSAWEWRSSRLAWAICGAIIASLSSLGGLLAWVAFAPALLIAGKRPLAVWITAAAITLGVYFHDYALSATAPTAVAIPRPGPLKSAEFLFAYLGAPIGYAHLDVAAFFGVVGALVLLIATPLLASHRRRDPVLARVGVVWLGLAAFAALSGAAVLAGRAGPFGQSSALYSRFHAFSSLWWVAAIVLTAMAVSTMRAPVATAGTGALPIRMSWLCVMLLACAGSGLVLANWQSAGTMAGFMAGYQARQGCVVMAVTADEDCLAYFTQDTDALKATVSDLTLHHRGVFGNAVMIPTQTTPAAPAYALLPEGDRKEFRCGGLDRGGRTPDIEVSPDVVRAVCARVMNQPWLTASAATMPWERSRFCIVPDWSVAGVWSTLPDGSYWCPIEWTLDDGRAASLINHDGSIIVHAFFPSNAYIPFADGQPARRAKS